MQTQSRHQRILEEVYAAIIGYVSTPEEPAIECNFGVSCLGGAFVGTELVRCEGRFELSPPSGSVMFARGDVSISAPAKQLFVGEDLLRIRLGLAGEGRLAGLKEPARAGFSGTSCFIVDQAPGSEIYWLTSVESRQCSITLWLPRGVMTELWQLNASTLPPFFREFEQQSSRPARAIIHSLSPQLAALAVEVMQCHLSGDLRQLYLEGKAREMISLLIALLQQQHSDDEPADIVLQDHDIKMLRQVHAIVSESYAHPPGIDELAHSVGLNRNKLSFGFKHLYGVSIFEYCRDLKLQRGMHLLQQKNMAISAIALEVGYENPPAFSSAFKKRFGCSPRQFQARGAVIPRG